MPLARYIVDIENSRQRAARSTVHTHTHSADKTGTMLETVRGRNGIHVRHTPSKETKNKKKTIKRNRILFKNLNDERRHRNSRSEEKICLLHFVFTLMRQYIENIQYAFFNINCSFCFCPFDCYQANLNE